MEKFKIIESKFINNLQYFHTDTKGEMISSFSNLWISKKDFYKHYNKRLHKENVIVDEYDYIQKTFNALASNEVFFETYELPELWDRIFYAKDDNWAVVVAQNGKILTSYKIKSTINETLDKHKEFLNAKIEKIGVSDEYSRAINKITEKLRKL